MYLPTTLNREEMTVLGRNMWQQVVESLAHRKGEACHVYNGKSWAKLIQPCIESLLYNIGVVSESGLELLHDGIHATS